MKFVKATYANYMLTFRVKGQIYHNVGSLFPPIITIHVFYKFILLPKQVFKYLYVRIYGGIKKKKNKFNFSKLFYTVVIITFRVLKLR